MRDPRRYSPYCPPTRSFSEPLSHAEYLRRVKENNTAPISSTNALVQYGEGEYKKTLWMEGLVGGACCHAVPSVPAAQTTQDAGLYTELKGAAAVGINEQKGVPESFHTLQKQGQAIVSEKCPGVSCQDSLPTPPTPPTVNFSYLAVQRGSGNFMYYVYNTLTNDWTYSSDSGYDSTYTFVEAGFVGDKFYTVFNRTVTNERFYHIIDLSAIIIQQYTSYISSNGFTSRFSVSPVLAIFTEATAVNSITVTRYDPISDTISSSSEIPVSSYTNYFDTIFYDLVYIRYRSSESPVNINHILWPLAQTDLPLPVYSTPGSPGISFNTLASSTVTAGILNNTHFASRNDGTYSISNISGANVTSITPFEPTGYSPTSIGRRIIAVTRGGWYEFYVYDYNVTPIGFIYINPTRRISTAFLSVSAIQNTYQTGKKSIASNSIAVSDRSGNIGYVNSIILANTVTIGNYTDISGSVVNGRVFALSKIAYNTYYQEPTFGYITGNSDNPVTTLLYMSNGSTWIQGSGTISNTRGLMSVTNNTGSYSLNKFFTVETMVPILEPNDSVIDLPVSSNTATQRAWNVVQQNLTYPYSNSGNSVISQGTYGMIIRPKNNTSIVRQIEFRPGRLFTERDPLTFTLEGSNDNGVSYTTIIANSPTNIIDDSNSGRRLFTYYSSVFANISSYSQYRLTFPTLRSGSVLEILKVQFLAEAPAGYLMDGAINAAITLNRNQTYHFKVNAPNDIFWIQTVPAPYSAANVYTTGVTNNGCKSSILTFAVSPGAPATLYYVSQTDPTKTGIITIVNSGAPSGNINGTWWSHMNTSSSNTYTEIWFSVENASQWGTSGVSIIQDTRPTSAPVAGSPYKYVMGASGQNFLFGKMFLISPTNLVYTGPQIQSLLQQYILNLNLFNSFTSVSFPKLYSHITPTTAYSLPSWASSVMTAPNGLASSSTQCITFNVSAYNDITVKRIATALPNTASQQFDIYYRIGGVQHIPSSAPTISTANGWIQFTTTSAPIAISGINTNLYAINSDFNINIAAGQTVGFCIRSSSNLYIQTNSPGSTVQFFENNDFRITVGDNAGYSGSGGPTMPFTLSTTPMTFAGLIQAERTVSPLIYYRNDLLTSTFFNTLKYGDVYTLLGTENTVRRFNYSIPNLFISSGIAMSLFNNVEYMGILETTQYTLNLRIIRAVESGDIIVPIRTNLIFLPSTSFTLCYIYELLGYFVIEFSLNELQTAFTFVRVTDGTVVASIIEAGLTLNIVRSDSKAIILNSNNTVTMFRNGILEFYTANTFAYITAMRFEQETNNTLFAYSTARALALTDSGYNVVTFPTPLTFINSTIVANNYLTLIQLNPLRIYVIDSSATLYTYLLDQPTTLRRRRNTETSMLVYITYPSSIPGPNSTTYILQMRDQGGNGWGGNRMELRQGSTTVATIGSTFTTGFGPIDISVTLTAGLSYSLVWTVGAASPNEVSVEIVNPSNASIYQMPFNSQALVGATLFTFTAQSLPSVIYENLYVTFDTITKQFYTSTATLDTVSNIVSNFIYQPV